MGNEFSNLMGFKFEMSVLSELKFFLNLQVNQRSNDNFVRQSKYVRILVKKWFGLESAKHAKTLMSTNFKTQVQNSMEHTLLVNVLYLTASR